jgi:hypothetical protein
MKSYRFKTIAPMGRTRQYVRWDWLFKQHLLKPRTSQLILICG